MKILETGTARFIGYHFAKVANRLGDNILDVKDKVYTRDIFNSDS